jgi:hypothetical protein
MLASLTWEYSNLRLRFRHSRTHWGTVTSEVGDSQKAGEHRYARYRTNFAAGAQSGLECRKYVIVHSQELAPAKK